MRILFLCRSFSYGGAERQLALLAAGLHRRGHDVYILTFYNDAELAGPLKEAGVPILSLRKQNRWDLVGFFLRLAKIVRALKPDVIHGYMSVANILAVSCRLFTPARIAIGIRASNMDLSHYDWLHRLSTFVEGRVARFAHITIANSQSGAMAAQHRGFPGDRMVVVPNGIDTSRFSPAILPDRSFRQRWGIPTDAILIGQVGRIDPMKDHSTFLRAARLVTDQEPLARFVCIGVGSVSYQEQLAALAADLSLSDRVSWVGSVSQMPAAYASLDLLCSSSRFGEGFSNVLGEALACGILCVATDVGDARLLLENIGEVVAPGDATALAAAMLRTIRLPARERTERIRRGVERIETLYREDALVERTVLALTRIV
ncbi:MAG: glycosyltransferase [Acidobacteriaceae bacterium]|nr:glycosyltransferase [Acidobacteriaceae bacterium]